jgi:lysophospholipase L1-like esterase
VGRITLAHSRASDVYQNLQAYIRESMRHSAQRGVEEVEAVQPLLRTTAVVVGATGATVGAAYGVLSQQGRRARRDIRIPGWLPLRADGVYLPDDTGPYSPTPPAEDMHRIAVLRLMILGDSTAAGLGVDRPEQLPGVILARGLAKETGRAVQLDTLAICGCTSRRLDGQVDAALIEPPHVTLIMIGANDVTRRIPPWESARLLGETVSRLRAAGTTVVVGTCPDLGTIRPIPQPLRAIAHRSSLALARLQRDAVSRAGGVPVPLAALLARDFRSQPDVLFSRDGYHPSNAGYEAACVVLLPALCAALLGIEPPKASRDRRSVVDRRSRLTGRATRLGSRTAVAGSPGTATPGSL